MTFDCLLEMSQRDSWGAAIKSITNSHFALRVAKAKISGWNNPPYTESLTCFMQDLHATSPAASSFVSANLHLHGNRSIRRKTAKSRGKPIIDYTQESNVARISKWVESVLDPERQAVSAVCIDACKTPEIVQTLLSNNKVVG